MPSRFGSRSSTRSPSEGLEETFTGLWWLDALGYVGSFAGCRLLALFFLRLHLQRRRASERQRPVSIGRCATLEALIRREEMASLVARIEAVIAPPGADLLKSFFDPEGPFAGTTFDDLPNNPPSRFTSDDIVAGTLLDMRFRPRAVRALLDTQSRALGTLLSAIPVDVDLWEASDEDLAAADLLYAALRSGGALKGIGPTTASKLIARKRPRLIPIVDSVVREALQLSDDSWRELRMALSHEGLPTRIEALRPPGAGHQISTLRLLDAAVWMRHSQGRAARAAQIAAGLRYSPLPDP